MATSPFFYTFANIYTFSPFQTMGKERITVLSLSFFFIHLHSAGVINDTIFSHKNLAVWNIFV